MGNAIGTVHAKAPASGFQSGIVPPPLTAPIPSGPVSEGGEKSITAKPNEVEKKSEKLTNPGTFDELHKKCKDVLCDPFSGFRLALGKGLSRHFQVSHTLNMSALPNGMSYQFGAVYLGGTGSASANPSPVLTGQIDNSGNLYAQMIHQLSKNTMAKCIVQTQQKELAMLQMDADYRGEECTAALTLGNIDILSGSGIIVNHYLQRLTPNLILGAECFYQYGSGQEMAVLSLAGKYSKDKWEAAFKFNPKSWNASYYHHITIGSENVSIGVDYEHSLKDSIVSLGYHYNLPKANVTVRGMLNTNWTVAAVYEKKLPSLPFSFCLSGMVNHVKNQCSFGFALQAD